VSAFERNLAEEPDVRYAAAENARGEAAAPAGEGAQEPTAPPVPEDARWYVIHTYAGYENKVKANLERRIRSMGMQGKIFQIVIPTEEQVEIKDGKRRTVERKIFPGYVLVQMVMTDESWYVVRNTPGVTGFVGAGPKPTPLLPEEVDAILRFTTPEAPPKPRIDFEEGESVKVRSGPFEGFVGVIDSIDADKGKLRVLVSLFGRETPVELDVTQVERL
jgi:transcriptional antiterminator NusG